MNKVTLYTKSCCSLCDSASFVIQRLRSRLNFEFETVDITGPGNENWFRLYSNDIPVVHLNGREVARHRVSERRLRQLLEDSLEFR